MLAITKALIYTNQPIYHEGVDCVSTSCYIRMAANGQMFLLEDLDHLETDLFNIFNID